MTSGRKQLLFIAGTIALSAALYFAPKKVYQGNSTIAPPKETSFGALLAEAKGQLKRQELEPLQSVENAISKDAGNLALLDSLGKMWDRLSFPFISAHYFEMIAEKQPSEKNWINAAYRYFDAFKVAGDSTLRSNMVEKSIESYKKVLEINPNNLDAKTDLGICYAEGTGNPMEGIKMLREVVQENPEHENAEFNLGILSVRSGQYDKAVQRFEKVLTINPNRLEARFLLARTQVELGQNEKALENLQLVKNQASDSQLIEEANSLISQINNHKNP